MVTKCSYRFWYQEEKLELCNLYICIVIVILMFIIVQLIYMHCYCNFDVYNCEHLVAWYDSTYTWNTLINFLKNMLATFILTLYNVSRLQYVLVHSLKGDSHWYAFMHCIVVKLPSWFELVVSWTFFNFSNNVGYVNGSNLWVFILSWISFITLSTHTSFCNKISPLANWTFNFNDFLTGAIY